MARLITALHDTVDTSGDLFTAQIARKEWGQDHRRDPDMYLRDPVVCLDRMTDSVFPYADELTAARQALQSVNDEIAAGDHAEPLPTTIPVDRLNLDTDPEQEIEGDHRDMDKSGIGY